MSISGRTFISRKRRVAGAKHSWRDTRRGAPWCSQPSYSVITGMVQKLWTMAFIGALYPFTAPMRKPCMKYFWKAKKKMIIGMAANAAPDISRP